MTLDDVMVYLDIHGMSAHVECVAKAKADAEMLDWLEENKPNIHWPGSPVVGFGIGRGDTLRDAVKQAMEKA